MKKKRIKPMAVNVTLPTKMTKPINNMTNYSFLLHGEKKGGKTSTVREAGRVLFLQFDPPQRAYASYEIHCPDWRTLKAALRKLEKECQKKKPMYDHVCIDGADIAYQYCLEHVCEQLVIKHPHDVNDYGRSWNAVKQEFSSVVTRILALPLGRWFISHSMWKEQELRDGRTVERLVPRLTSQAEEVLNSAVDAWFAFDVEGLEGRRVLILQGDEVTGAGHRIDTEDYPHFRCARTNKPLRQITLGKSPREGYEAIVSAFDNEYESAIPKKKKKGTKRNR